MRPRRIGAVAALLAGAVLGAPAAAGAATFSDSFAGRESVAGFVTVTGSNQGAGREAGEPALRPLSPAGHTVWVEWEATSTGFVSLATCGSAINTVLAVYTGTQLDQLTEVASAASYGSACPGVRDGVTFFASSGNRYEIVVDGNSFYPPLSSPPLTEGFLSLAIEATPRPVNDDFAGAIPVVGRTSEEPGGAGFYFASEFGYNWGAGKEQGEPNHAGDVGGASVWYSWTSPESRQAKISICCSAVQLLGVYNGDSVGALSEVRSGKGSLEFPATAGTVYKIAVDGGFSATLGGPALGNFTLAISMNPPLRPEEAAPALPQPSLSPPPHRPAPPRTRLIKARVRQKAHTATFTFLSNVSTGGFRCRLDGHGWSACASPRTYAKIGPGAHVFRVRAFDAAGVADPTPVVSHFSIRPERRHRS